MRPASAMLLALAVSAFDPSPAAQEGRWLCTASVGCRGPNGESSSATGSDEAARRPIAESRAMQNAVLACAFLYEPHGTTQPPYSDSCTFVPADADRK